MIRCENLGILRANILALGHQYLANNIVDLFLRQSVDEFVGDHPWPWRNDDRVVLEGEELAGIDIVNQVRVNETGTSLAQGDREELVDQYGSLGTVVGVPQYWFRQGDAIHTYPVYSGEIRVNYFSRYGWCNGDGTNFKARPVNDTDTPIAPARCQEIIELGARVRAKSEAQDFEQAAELRQQYETRVEEERSRPDQVDEFRTIRVTQGDWA